MDVENQIITIRVNNFNEEHFKKLGYNFNLNDYPVVCLYNLGSLFNENEISLSAIQYIFKSLNICLESCLQS